MKFTPAAIPDIVIVEPDVHKDPRGIFMEIHHAKKYADGGIKEVFVQDNISNSIKNTLRGLHCQMKNPQGKLMSVLEGEIFDVAVDIRKNSPTFKKWFGIELSSENHKQVYIPPGFAHGFFVLSPSALVCYKCTQFYDPKDETGIYWNDPSINIQWPHFDPLLSDKDKVSKKIDELLDILPHYKGA